MTKRWYSIGFVLMAVLFGYPMICPAFTLLTKEQALKQVFFSGAELETESQSLSGAVKKRIEKRLGGKLVFHQAGSESAAVRSKRKVTFIFAKKNGVRKGVAIIEVQPGKWGPVEFIVAMDVRGTIKAVRVMSYQEIRGRPIARLAFMNQYRGKTVNSTLTVGKDIVGISGATISSRAATFTVKKALVMYEEFYLKK